jgi:hypothetical protein
VMEAEGFRLLTLFGRGRFWCRKRVSNRQIMMSKEGSCRGLTWVDRIKLKGQAGVKGVR